MLSKFRNYLEANYQKGVILFALLLVASLLMVKHCSAQTKIEVLMHLKSIGVKHPEIVTKQSILECGHHYESYNARKRNNLFGLWNHSKQQYYKFDTWKESCAAYVRMIEYKLKPGEDYYVFLTRIGYATSKTYIQKLKQIKI